MHFREAKFQNFPGEHGCGPPSLVAPFALDAIWAGLTLNFRRAGYFQSVILTMILTYLTYTKRCFLFSVERGALPYSTEIYVLRTADMRSAQA